MQNLAFIIPPESTKFVPELTSKIKYNLDLESRTCCFTREIDGVGADLYYRKTGQYVDVVGRVNYTYGFYSASTADGRSLTDVMLRLRAGYYPSLALPEDKGEYVRVRARFTMTLRNFVHYELETNRRVRKLSLKPRSMVVDKLLNEAICNPHLQMVDPRLLLLYNGVDDIKPVVLRKHFDGEIFGLNTEVVRRMSKDQSYVDPYHDRERASEHMYPAVASRVLTNFINPDLNVGRQLVVSSTIADTIETRKSGLKFDEDLLQVNIVRLNQPLAVGNNNALALKRTLVSIRPTNIGDTKRHRLNVLIPESDGYIHSYREGDYIAVLQNPVSNDFIFIAGVFDRKPHSW